MTRRAPGARSYDDVPISALLQSARQTYTLAVEREQRRTGHDDLTATGSYLLSAMNWAEASLEAVIRWMGVSKQSVGQTVDLLVARGYLERGPDPLDRRKVRLALTRRGRAAGAAARRAIEAVDRELLEVVGERAIAQARATLVTLRELGPRPGRVRAAPGRRSGGGDGAVPGGPRLRPSADRPSRPRAIRPRAARRELGPLAPRPRAETPRALPASTA